MTSSLRGSVSEASSSMRTSSMRSPLSSAMMSPVSSRLAMEFETAFMIEAEEPVRFAGTDILPYLSQPSSCSSSSDFDTQSDSSGSTSFCNFNDSNRITLGSLIGLPMDSFRHFGESLRFMTRGDNLSYDSGSSRTIEGPPRRSRTCSLLSDIFRCLQRSTRTDYVNDVPVQRNLNNLTSFTITEVSEEEEQDSESDTGPTVFENSVFVERPTLGSRIYEFNPLYISDAISEADPTEVRDLSLSREVRLASGDPSPKDSGGEERPESKPATKLSLQASTQTAIPQSECHRSSPSLLYSSNIRTVLTTICCRLGDECQSD